MAGIARGEVWWADLPGALPSDVARAQPVLIVQAESFNRSFIQTVLVAAITSNLELAGAPGNVLLPARASGLPRDSVVNEAQLLTLDRSQFTERAGTLAARLQSSMDAGLRLVLELELRQKCASRHYFLVCGITPGSLVGGTMFFIRM